MSDQRTTTTRQVKRRRRRERKRLEVHIFPRKYRNLLYKFRQESTYATVSHQIRSTSAASPTNWPIVPIVSHIGTIKRPSQCLWSLLLRKPQELVAAVVKYPVVIIVRLSNFDSKTLIGGKPVPKCSKVLVSFAS